MEKDTIVAYHCTSPEQKSR